MNNYFVYMHTSPSNKVYIGITQNCKKRWRNGLGYYSNKHFYNAIQKYGWDNFKHEILYKNLSLEKAEQKEIELIKQYNATDNRYGYNHAIGGKVNRGYRLSEETRKKLSESHIGKPSVNKGKKLSKKQNEALQNGRKKYYESDNYIPPTLGKKVSDETKKKMRDSHKGIHNGENNYWYGKHFSDEHKNKISKALSGRMLSDEHKKHLSESRKGKQPNRVHSVIQYSLNNNYIQKFESIVKAEEITGISRHAISHAVRGHTKGNISNGFIWKYENYNKE